MTSPSESETTRLARQLRKLTPPMLTLLDQSARMGLMRDNDRIFGRLYHLQGTCLDLLKRPNDKRPLDGHPSLAHSVHTQIDKWIHLVDATVAHERFVQGELDVHALKTALKALRSEVADQVLRYNEALLQRQVALAEAITPQLPTWRALLMQAIAKEPDDASYYEHEMRALSDITRACFLVTEFNKNRDRALPNNVYDGHDTLIEMVSTHVSNWESLLKGAIARAEREGNEAKSVMRSLESLETMVKLHLVEPEGLVQDASVDSERIDLSAREFICKNENGRWQRFVNGEPDHFLNPLEAQLVEKLLRRDQPEPEIESRGPVL